MVDSNHITPAEPVLLWQSTTVQWDGLHYHKEAISLFSGPTEVSPKLT